MTDYVQSAAGWAMSWVPSVTWQQVKEGHGQAARRLESVVTELREAIPQQGHLFSRIAGLSGAAAVAFHAYGTHVLTKKEADSILQSEYDTGVRYHFINSAVLLAVPLTSRPNLVGSLLLTGTVLFSGSYYAHALTADPKYRKLTPYGSMFLCLGWLVMALSW